MKRYSLICICLMGFVLSGIAQQSENYKYIRVPDKFDFLKEENKYQLNALTAFLLEKQGYVVLYKLPAPEGVDPCEILQADVENNSNLFKSKVKILFRDCHQQVVFSSEEGSSRKKDFKASYHEAFREAFESLEEVRLAALNPDEDFDMPKKSARKVTATERSERSNTGNTGYQTNTAANPDSAFFVNGSFQYELRKSASGYDLYKEGQEEKFATLTKSGGGDNFIYTSTNIRGNAYFNKAGDLLVEYIDSNSDQLVTVTYRNLDQ